MVTEDPKDQRRVEALVGHPLKKSQALREKVQAGIKTFSEVEKEFLDLIWCMDMYRVQRVIPRGMGNPDTTDLGQKLGGVYRTKGNYFSELAQDLLGQKTTSRLESNPRVWGFSQAHQIDIAWPARDVKPLVDPLICCEAKLTGAPPYPGGKGRGPLDDWSNRRKELKFQAADLKLYRHSVDTSIPHWDLWRKDAPPYVYSLWAARILKPDDPGKMIKQVKMLTDTYSDGVGIYAFQVKKSNDGYEPAALSKGVSERVTSLDSVLSLISAQIKQIMEKNGGKVPAPIVPAEHPAADDMDDH